ncbi:Photosystem II PsbW [Macleaya cordata]|uniref:PSII 6.1 kDa protein n=1 Tax=Macleaya cordata TaxID=56857 RepID=A0A200R0J0_MACCD|nr:Photosystem II PsbW [Macleaya cordata]
MATITASTSTALVARAGLVRKGAFGISSSPVLGLPAMAERGRLRCSMEEKRSTSETSVGMGASLMAAASTMMTSNPALALVDERLSTEGTGLPFGLSNNLLGWILLGVFALIWANYFIYTSTLEEDEESGLSL